jgi:hypothetical protein
MRAIPMAFQVHAFLELKNECPFHHCILALQAGILTETVFPKNIPYREHQGAAKQASQCLYSCNWSHVVCESDAIQPSVGRFCRNE